jgi:hypothetical protein
MRIFSPIKTRVVFRNSGAEWRKKHYRTYTDSSLIFYIRMIEKNLPLSATIVPITAKL